MSTADEEIRRRFQILNCQEARRSRKQVNDRRSVPKYVTKGMSAADEEIRRLLAI
ncbi:hypothetical protein [Alteribacter aurantiacus]|uniref:hypothetical protein n=1 Tax=Alteribacter aurantiacus TaxID=254410 RepID=UPI001969CEDD|nr:hypothetical protein [Alteribacter aurantiacus]